MTVNIIWCLPASRLRPLSPPEAPQPTPSATPPLAWPLRIPLARLQSPFTSATHPSSRRLRGPSLALALPRPRPSLPQPTSFLPNHGGEHRMHQTPLSPHAHLPPRRAFLCVLFGPAPLSPPPSPPSTNGESSSELDARSTRPSPPLRHCRGPRKVPLAQARDSLPVEWQPESEKRPSCRIRRPCAAPSPRVYFGAPLCHTRSRSATRTAWRSQGGAPRYARPAERLVPIFLRTEYQQHSSAIGARTDGIFEVAASPDALERLDEAAEGMAPLVNTWAKVRERGIEWECDLHLMGVGEPWRMHVLAVL